MIVRSSHGERHDRAFWWDDSANLLARVAGVIDPAAGTIRLKAKVADADEMTLDTRSTRTVRVRK